MKTARILSAVLLLATVSGCASLFETFDEGCMNVRNKKMAYQAWDRWQWCYADMPCRADFARGFRDGYQDVVEGGTGCQPVLPPRFYWSVHYQNANGHCHINAWFDGYTHGAMAAAQDGYASAGRIPISPTARGNWMRRQQLEQEASQQRNQAYYSRDKMAPVPAPLFGQPQPLAAPAATTPADSGTDGDGDGGGDSTDPAGEDGPPRPYEEDAARYMNDQFMIPLPAQPQIGSAPGTAGVYSPLN